MIKGISQNTNPEGTPPQYIYWAKNAILNYKLDAAINELGTTLDLPLSPYNLLFKNGIITFNQYIILFYKSQALEDCIAVINTLTNTLSIKVQRTDLNFQINYPITGVAKFNSNSELIVAFVDAINTPKYINLDTALLTDSLNFYNLFPISYSASDMTTEVIDGGSLTNGAYFITFQYISRDRSRSTFTTISNPIYVTNIDANQTFTATKGNEANTSSNKAIRVTLSNLDTSYSKIAVAVITKIGGVVAQKLIKEVGITGSNLSFVYNGIENIGDITLDELITDTIRYTSAKHVTTLNDQLFLADLKTPAIVDYQSIVNSTTIEWASTLDTNNTLSGSSKYKDGNNKTFIHDEVYALYMQFELLDGTFTDWFHIPGRELSAGQRADSSLSMGGLQIAGRNPKVYEVEDTASYTGTIAAPAGIVRTYGNMGVWENSDETYGAGFGSLTGQKVRHHKFPSVEFMANNAYSGQASYGISCLDRLEIQVTNGAIDYNIVKGYRIGYAKRSLADVGVVGMGLTMFAASPNLDDSPVQTDTNTLISSAGNFNINSFNGGDDNIMLNKNYLRFNSFDVWQDRPALTGTYLRNYLKLTANKLASSAVGYAGGPTYGMIHPGSGSFDIVAYACNFTIQGANNTTKTTVVSADRVKKLTNPMYLPNNVKLLQDSIVINNLGLEETVFAKIEGTLGLNAIGALETQTNLSQDDPIMGEETYLASLKNPKSNFFLDFENQSIVVNPTLIRGGAFNSIYNTGDGFVGVYSYAALASYNRNVDPTVTETERIVNFKMHVSVGRHNMNMRYQKAGDYTSYFYPDAGTFTLDSTQTDKYWFYAHSRKSEWNKFLYSKDYSSVNEYEVFGVFNRDIPDQSNYAYRIARSTKASRENALEDGWRSFKIADYFDTVRTKGEITNIEAWGNDALIIHHRNALFRTRDKAVLKTDLLSVTLGSGDIFEIEPKEENPTPTGTGGTQHKFSCKLTDSGYFFVDAEGYAVYQYDGQTLKDVGAGLSNFFAEYLGANADNPFNDEGITIAFDPYYYRLLLSQKAGTNSFTLSYDLSQGEWMSSHDFIPDYIFNTRNNLYSFKNNQLYTHNWGNYGEYYGTVYPFYIDFVVNARPTEQKVLEAINYLCKIKNEDGTIAQRKTLTSVTIWNDQHCTGKVDLITNELDSLFLDANVKVTDETWHFNEIKDKINDPNLAFLTSLLTDSRPIPTNLQDPAWYDSEPVRGKFFIVRLEYSNIENKEVHLRELIPNLRLSKA